MTKKERIEKRKKHKELASLIIEQERDDNIIHQYEQKHFPEDAEFVQKKRRDIEFRDRRIRALKDKIQALETVLANM